MHFKMKGRTNRGYQPKRATQYKHKHKTSIRRYKMHCVSFVWACLCALLGPIRASVMGRQRAGFTTAIRYWSGIRTNKTNVKIVLHDVIVALWQSEYTCALSNIHSLHEMATGTELAKKDTPYCMNTSQLASENVLHHATHAPQSFWPYGC